MPRKKQERRGEKPQYRARAKTWVARVWEADGTCSGWTDLGTSNKDLALQRYERWLATGTPPEPGRGKETFAAAADRVVKKHEAEGAIDAGNARRRRQRIRDYALPQIGQLEVCLLEPHHVASVLDVAAKQVAAGTVLALRSDISQILAQLVREGEILHNPARSMALPKGATADTRERVGLTDEQLLKFQQLRGFREPIDIMVMLCRQVGGHRTSDIHAGRWEDVDQKSFASMKVRRPKTDGETGAAVNVRKRKARAYERVDHEIDESLRVHLKAYWLSLGRPQTGPLFPRLRDAVSTPMKLKDGRSVERRGGKAGERKGEGSSYAKVFRRAVWECGIYDPMPGFDPEAPDKALCRLQTDTDETRRLDFHSLRRGLVTALADAGVSELDQLATTGHTQLTTQLKHYMGKRRVKVPRSALPGGAVESAVPALTPEQRAALVALLGGASAILPESGASRDRIPDSGMKRASPASTAARK